VPCRRPIGPTCGPYGLIVHRDRYQQQVTSPSPYTSAGMAIDEETRKPGQPMGESLGMERRPSALTLSEDDRRVLAVWAADCAERTLSLFEAQTSSDTRPRDAIDGLRAFARGEMRIGKVRALAAPAGCSFI